MTDPVTETDEESSTVLQNIEQLLSLSEHERDEKDIEDVSMWFRNHSSLLRSMETDRLCGVIRGSKLLTFKPDHVIVHQGDIGDSFYIIIRGCVVLYARKVEHGETDALLHDVVNVKGPKDRLRFGQELNALRTGRCFGESNVIGTTAKRNASVIADEATVLVRIDKDLYVKHVSENFATEIADMSSYINMHPLFRSWPSAYRNLLSENFTYRKFKFGECLVRQGEVLETVYFIIKGQVKLRVNCIKHTQQFSQLLLKIKHELSVFDDEDEYEFHPYKNITTMGRRRLRQKEGFFASELRYRELDVCTIGHQGIIGDVEAIMDLNKYTVTAECIEELTLYEMDKSTFMKTVARKSPETYDRMRRSVFEKIHYRNSFFEGGLPIYQALLISFAKPKLKDSRKFILNSYKKKKSKEKPVSSKFFSEMARGYSVNSTKKRQFRAVQVVRGRVLNEEAGVDIAENEINTALWRNVGLFSGKMKLIEEKIKEDKEVKDTTEPGEQKFTANDYKELKKKLQAAGRTGRK